MPALQEHVTLQYFNTMGIRAQARYYAHIHNPQQLRFLVTNHKLPVMRQLILGGGSNVLFLNDFEGIVLHMAIRGINIIRENEEYVWIQAGAGVGWHELVKYCVQQNYAGIENLSWIPGTVGASPIQNIGAYGVSLSDVFVALEAMEVCSGNIHTFTHADCAFGYRDSVFKNELQGKYIILYVTLRLYKKPRFQTTYSTLQAALTTMNIRTLSVKTISDAIIHIRRHRLPDPAHLGNAGSFFKNPIITQQQFKKLQLTYPDIPRNPQPNGHVKIPAAWLIEQCGWKGHKRGAVGVHEQHALVLVNYGDGTGHSIYQLAQDIQQSVQERFNLTLVPEVCVIR